MVFSTRRRYDRNFKDEAVKLVVEQGLSAAEVERRLNIGAGNVNRWVRGFCPMYDQEPLLDNGLEEAKQEISRLKKDLEQAIEERDILMSCLKALTSRN